MRARVFGSAIVVAMALMGGLAGPAWAASNNQTFTIFFQGSGTSEPPGTVVASGVINGAGTDKTVSDSQSGSVERLDFPGQGTLFITTTNDPNQTQSFDPRTCVGTFSGTGTWRITKGTGDFAGATGSGTYTLQGTFIADRTESGGCAKRSGTFVVLVTATGHVNLADSAAA